MTGLDELRPLVRAAFEQSVRDFDLAGRVRLALADRPRASVFAVGKAALRMLAGALDSSVERALVVVPQQTELLYLDPRVELLWADHPEPSALSVAAAERALAFFAGHDSVLALISGGSSALLCAPPASLSLTEKRALLGALMRAGASIQELNLVRRHLSRVKGGGLLRVARGPCVTLVASDVLSGEAYDVGSGPTVADPTSIEAAREVLRRFALSAELSETLKPSEEAARLSEHHFVATPDDLANEVRARLEDEGLASYLLAPSGQLLEELLLSYVGLAKTLLPGQALVRVAEPVLRVRETAGKGGRNCHLALSLAGRLPEDVVFLAGASDGVDGNSETGGALVDARALRGFDVPAALAAFDSGVVVRAAECALGDGRPSGLNLCDVHVLARARASA